MIFTNAMESFKKLFYAGDEANRKKTRAGGKIIKVHDNSRTPHQRLMECSALSELKGFRIIA